MKNSKTLLFLIVLGTALYFILKYYLNIDISVFLIVGFIFIFIYREAISTKAINSEIEKNHKILDSQKSFIIITDGKDLKSCNIRFLEFLGFESLDRFKSRHSCVCELFEYEDGKNYLLENMHGENWFNYLLKHKDFEKIVKISDKEGIEHLFYIEFDVKDKLDEDNYIITFIDITKVKGMEGQLVQSEKMASLAKMIGNIAHQWRQPLSVISIAASGLKLKDEFGKLDSKSLHKNLDMIISNSKYLSETINTFRDLVKDEKIEKDAKIQDILNGVINIMNVSFNNKNIQLIENIDYETDMTKKLVIGELSQVLTNLLNNAADIIVDRSIKEPQITVECFMKNSIITITVEDNAGGISDEIINNIFDPYFTTKHQSQGVGLGLYMSYKIVQESLGGKLYVRNTKVGAKFFIELPM